MDVRSYPSPNFGPRRDGLQPSLVVLHFTAMANPDEALARLCAPEHEVSAHYLIHRDGHLYQMVDEEMRAWHAGAGSWRGVDDINSRSIGIELDNDGASPFSEPQMEMLERLLADILSRWSIPPEGVIGHSDLAPLRKADPGRRFDWARLARQKMAIWPNADESDVDEDRFLDLAEQFGYARCAGVDAILDVLRQRFRPWGQGGLGARDMAIIEDLAHRFPVDRSTPVA